MKPDTTPFDKMLTQYVETETTKNSKEILTVFLQVAKELKNNIDKRVNEADKSLKEAQGVFGKLESRMRGILAGAEDAPLAKVQELSQIVSRELRRIESIIPKNVASEIGYLEDLIAKVEAKIPTVPKEIVAEKIRSKLESLKGEERLDKSAIKGLDDDFKKIDGRLTSMASAKVMGGGRNMRGSYFSFAGNASTTLFYLPTDVAGKGLFIFAHYQGQWLQQGVHYTLNGKQFNTVGGTSPFTAETSTTIEGFIINL